MTFPAKILISLSLLLCTNLVVAAPAQKGGKQAADQTMTEMSEQQREQAAERQEAAEEMAAERQEAAEDRMEEAPSEQSRQMQARKDERKEIKEEYKASGEKTKGKKPWWKLWE